MNEEYKPRFSFEISEEQKSRADRILNVHGIRKSIFNIILDDLLDMIDEHGNIVIGVILDHAAKPRELLKSMAKAEEASNGNNR